MNDRHDFSTEYEDKKKALLRSIEKADRVEKRQRKVPVMRAITAVVLAIVMLSGGVFAATRIGLFNIKREEDKILVEVATGQTVENVKPNGRPKARWFKIYSDYMPPITDCEAGPIPNWEIGIRTQRGATMKVLIADYATKEDFILQLPLSTKIEEFEINGRRAMLAFFGETVEWNKILFVEFEEEDSLVYCVGGFRISEDELKKFAVGLSIESLSTEEAEYLFENDESFQFYSHESSSGIENLTDLGDKFRDPLLPHCPAIDEMTSVGLGESFKYFDAQFNINVEVTPIEVNVYDSASEFEHEEFKYLSYSITDENGIQINHISMFMDDEGNLIEYPRNTIIKSDNDSEQDRFSETEMVRKKLVGVTYNVKNTSDGVSRFYSNVSLYVGNEADAYKAYVYDRTPMFYTNNGKVYTSGIDSEGCKLEVGEEITITDYYLVDEDLVVESYCVFNTVRRYVRLSD